MSDSRAAAPPPGDDAAMDPEADARALVNDRFPTALAAFLGGSVLSERRTPTSDLDIVVVVPPPDGPYRESIMWRNWHVDLFVQRADTIGPQFAWARARRWANLARMCTSGVMLLDGDGTGAAVRQQALAVQAAGPPPLTPSELNDRRYRLTGQLDDLAGCSDPGETVVICWYVFVATAELALLLKGSWLGSGKWLLRELRAADPVLAADLIAAREDPARLAQLADGVLAGAGGRLWAGYRRAAKP